MSLLAPAPRPEHAPFLDTLRGALGERDRIRTRPIDIHANAHDASHFLLLPEAVAIAEDAAEVGALFAAAARAGRPVTLRSGGTSLSGQALTDGVLIDVRRNFKKIEVLDGGDRVRVQPGVTVRALNAHLARFGKKFGPDPASEAACTIGGVVANNSSGMSCGTTENSYRTLESLTVVLASGTVIDTGAADAEERLRALEPELYRGLLTLAERVRSNPASVQTIRRQFAMKNTMGYGINSLLDYTRAVDILAHLIIGSEGTLGFVAEAVFRTVDRPSHASTGLLIFDSLEAANSALPDLVDTGAATLELLDALSLRIGQRAEDAPAEIRGLNVDRHAALLVEYQSGSAEHLADLQAAGDALMPRLGLSREAAFSSDAGTRADLWHLRKGLYTTVAGARPQGTTALLEDVVVPVERLAATCNGLIDLFDRYEYENSVIFGHAKDGNVHFMLTDGFIEADQVARYAAFTEDLVDLILGEGGSLKAEHGTGRVMAPFVRRQYGDELYDVMREIKRLCDPAGLLNPGVILDEDPEAHLRHIKAAMPVDEEVDRCVECGYCEPVCPSRDITLTPRQRIVTLRAIEQAKRDGDHALVKSLEKDYVYDGVRTCAVDGMCQTACPVSINTGSLVKKLRREENNAVEKAVWNTAAKHWGAVTVGAGMALNVVDKIPMPIISGPNKLARAVLGKDTVPLYSAELPAGGVSRSRPAPTAPADVVYMPACVNTMFGPAADGSGRVSPGVQLSFEQLCESVGLVLLVPESINSLCCGTPWSSKGQVDGQHAMRERTVAALREASRDGELTIVCDASSCTEGILHAIEESNASSERSLRVVDAVDFVAERVLPLLPEHNKMERLVLHPTCSSTRMGGNDALNTVAKAVAKDVVVPENWGCCAFAGDRGMLHPELTASATAREAAEVAEIDASAYASCNRTCELGMTRATGEEYNHVLELLAQLTRSE
ncbi:FAD-binding and (Fe-S)-binding domain-containing protein [Mycetocola spongiae]|uniref:FAD-binding and (Fe-S)-binding domain-containing protein n=1 Tax=Mycetocola spongiae TaxID=2859226 RepID=UPI001CF36FA6|nr:FAD-binding and (Fe-S)-binding domain-containing protein [Mycetocola spongiae]UCR88953.1 FAD-binding oxidoreductase [Mycetocola spongiae]